MPVVTNTPITMSYFVRDVANALLTYNRMRWYRSATENGLYEAATGTAPGPAILNIGDSTAYQVAGLTLSLEVSGTRVDVTFVGTDPLTPADVQGQIEAATALLTTTLSGNTTVNTTVTTGTAASIKVLDGDANPFLDIAEGAGAVGTDQDTILVSGTHEYFLTDSNSDPDYWYRIEFRNTATPSVSPWSVPFPANQAQSVPISQTIVAYLRLADLSGSPIECREVVLANVFLPNRVGADLEWGVFRHYKKIVTDRNGYAEIRILRGITVDLSITGTGFVRRITIPTTGDSVHLLDPALVVHDEFGIQEPTIDFALRTS